jgi:hypothetical protein
MTSLQVALLESVLPAILLPLLAALAASIGLAHARKAVLVLALLGLVCSLIIFAVALVRSIRPRATETLYILQWPNYYASLAASLVGSVGGTLAIIRTAQIMRWRWFGSLLVAQLVTVVARFLMNPILIEYSVGAQWANEFEYSQPLTIIENALFCTTFVAQLLYGIFGPDTPVSNAATQGAQSPTA